MLAVCSASIPYDAGRGAGVRVSYPGGILAQMFDGVSGLRPSAESAAFGELFAYRLSRCAEDEDAVLFETSVVIRMSWANVRAGGKADWHPQKPEASCGLHGTWHDGVDIPARGPGGVRIACKTRHSPAVQSCQRSPSALAAVDTFITRRRSRLRTGTKW